jgi:type III restriction enzyme
VSTENPILNNPYREPQRHYATNLDGELDYERVIEGRRMFSASVQTVPTPQRGQRSLLEINQAAAASHGNHIINVLRREVKAWRDGGYQNATRLTRELLRF